MSEVRMCDQCARIFSLNEYGWRQYQETQTYGANGNSRTMHICPDHNVNNGGQPLRPSLDVKQLEAEIRSMPTPETQPHDD